MSKPISFGFGRQKSSQPAPNAGYAARKPPPISKGVTLTALRNDSDNEDEQEPRHESVTGFSSSGAILSQPKQETKELVIKNGGNGDWRRRGRKNLLPSEVQAQQQGGDVVMIERQEVSRANGLQFADASKDIESLDTNGGQPTALDPSQPGPRPKELTADEEALQALLDDGTGKPKSTAVIEQQGNSRLSFRDEIEDFRDDVASRPEPSTLEDYAAMPVEEFGLAMLRGMGQKRRARGEAIDLNPQTDDNPRKIRKQDGFLGIGAKPVSGTNVELGAWGKADMRKNHKGQGFFTPLMRVNNVTGETISEDELQKRIKDAKGQKGEEDWRRRRDRNLEHSGRDRDRDQGRDRDRKALTNGDDDYRDSMNSFSRPSSSKPDREHHRSKRDIVDSERDSSGSRREDERSKDRRRRDEDDYDSRRRDKHRDRHRDDDKYESSSSHRGHREKDRDRDRHKDSDGDRRHRDRR